MQQMVVYKVYELCPESYGLLEAFRSMSELSLCVFFFLSFYHQIPSIRLELFQISCSVFLNVVLSSSSREENILE